MQLWKALTAQLGYGEEMRRLPEGGHPRFRLEPEPDVIYAVGDVHGCYDLLKAMQADIDADAARFERPVTILLGDVIDRGPASCDVLDYLTASRPENHPRYVLLGNHEALFEQFLERPSARAPWLAFGGTETLASYGIPINDLYRLRSSELSQLINSYIPLEHRQFVADMPLMIETAAYVFVHAGIRPDVPLLRQTAQDLLWFRDDLTDRYEHAEKTVVHGHTPTEEPLVSARRIDVDTGAHLTGRLTAVRLTADGPSILTRRQSELF